MHIRIATLLLLVIGLGIARTADAQYFGRNKVQYEKFDFKVLQTEHFDIYFYPEEEAAVQLAARMAERWYTRLSTLLRHELNGRQPLILYASAPHFRQTNVVDGIGEGTGGVTEGFKRRIVMPFAGGLAETDHVLGHELVHAFQYDLATGRDAEGNAIGPGVGQLPLWFIEGMAEYLSLGPVDANTAMWVREAASREAMPTVDDLNNPNFFPYRYGHAFWAYVAGRWGDAAVGDMLRATGPNADIEVAMQTVLGVDEETFTSEWHAATQRAYAPFFETGKRAEAFAKPLITEGGTGSDLNLAPAISPDGKRLVFLSERSEFSIDLYLADAQTGRVIRKIVETASDPHFDSIQFLTSAGDWAPDNRRFVFAGLSKGQPVLAIVNVDNGNREAEHEFKDLDEIFNPAWSPDGRQIAFSALKGGLLDLYLFDLQSGNLRQLTNDPYADLDPEWSPDGQALAWVTDRFSSNAETLSFGNYRIALMDVRSGNGRALTGFSEGRNTNPEFSADGRSLYFVGTPDGIPNLYRASLQPQGGNLVGGTTTRLTNLVSGVSGITPLTPALSAAAAAPDIVFTVFEDGHHNIYATTAAAGPAGGGSPDRNAAVLPPADRKEGDVVQLLDTPTTGLPPAQTALPQEDYKAKLSLDAVGQPTVGVGADRFGAYAAGGLSFLFSDILGNHTLGATFQATNRFSEIGGAITYLNREHRWNYGLIVEQTPYVTGGFARGVTTVDGRQAFVEQTRRLTQINSAVSGVAHYPFSRAQRLEFTGGARRIGFDHDVETNIFSLVTGERLDNRIEELDRPDAVYLGEAGTALAYDTSIMGATAPVMGQRYRLELTQTAGTLTYAGALVDYRRYVMPVRPFTFAFRGLHYGRYGSGGEDPRLAPLYVGYPGLVRGYEVNSFDPTECIVESMSCAAFDQLVGSRIAVLGGELRFPLFGLFSRDSLYGPLPVDIAFFGDAGTAWTSGDDRVLGDARRDWVRSYGAALRFNAFGYAILELDYVRPLDRPGRGWMWQFNLTPGF
jgi:Tol biopolymer transport system component